MKLAPMKLAEIASTLDARLENGSPETEITGVAGIEEAGPHHVTFVANPKYAAAARTTKAAAVIVAEDFPAIPSAMLRSKNPYLAFAKALALFHQPAKYAPGVHPTAVVHASARIGAGAHIGPYVVIGEEVEIGKNAVLLAHVVIYRGARIGDNFFAHAHAVVREGCRLGNNVLLQNGVVIGADGFGFAKDDAGRWHKIPQPQPVVIEDDVEIQANTCIDRASVGETHIGRGTKIDNLVQVGHGSHIGEDALLASQVGLAGSTVDRQQRDSHRASGGGRPLQSRRWRHRHTPERRCRRHCSRSHCQRSTRRRAQVVVEVFSPAEQVAGNRKSSTGKKKLSQQNQKAILRSHWISSVNLSVLCGFRIVKLHRQPALDHATYSLHQLVARAEIFRLNGVMEDHIHQPRLDGKSSLGHHVMRAHNRNRHHWHLTAFRQIKRAFLEGDQLAIERAVPFHINRHVDSLTDHFAGKLHRGDACLAVAAIDWNQRAHTHGFAEASEC